MPSTPNGGGPDGASLSPLLSALHAHIPLKELQTRLKKHQLITSSDDLSSPDLDSLLVSLSQSEWEDLVLSGASLGVRRRVWNTVAHFKSKSRQRTHNSKKSRRSRAPSSPNRRSSLLDNISFTDDDDSSSSSSDDDDVDLPNDESFGRKMLFSDDGDEMEGGDRKKSSEKNRKKAKEPNPSPSSASKASAHSSHSHMNGHAHHHNGIINGRSKPSKHVFASDLQIERFKTLLAFGYALVVSWITSFTMVIVHDRVPDMDRYPPLPDILLDNLPHIPWAFEICELTGMILMTLWGLVCLFHKHRFILMRRFFSISGTIFLLRCVTMLLTSLSVPGKHLDCAPRPYGDIWNKLYNAYVIWTGAGMTLQGVRTCGDYMFSGHTVSLTLLNFFITEYTSRRIYFLHTFTWICNAFGVFFILAAHEHYSIDVFIAFYISSRLFLYYHTLANNKGSGKVGHRGWFYFPLFYFFESNVDGKVPNEFEWPITLADVGNTVDRVKAKAVRTYKSVCGPKPESVSTSSRTKYKAQKKNK